MFNMFIQHEPRLSHWQTRLRRPGVDLCVTSLSRPCTGRKSPPVKRLSTRRKPSTVKLGVKSQPRRHTDDGGQQCAILPENHSGVYSLQKYLQAAATDLGCSTRDSPRCSDSCI